MDWSEGGVSVECHRALRIGECYRFTLEGDHGRRSFEGTVLWCRLRRTRATADGEVEPVYRAGIARRESGDERPDPEPAGC